ncbi:hypothetical protein GCM10022252_76310 [Streptosporangium oxazolinicum]|uniref:Uncharacterized protein n=1 Tax=Streptosporangium oxazolinicum TaxID=909287 RepID=A0ABP8BL54_9ACTN
MKRSLRRNLLRALRNGKHRNRYNATARFRLPAHVLDEQPPVWAPAGYVTITTGSAWARRLPDGRLHLLLSAGGHTFEGRTDPYQLLAGTLAPYGDEEDSWPIWLVNNKHHQLHGYSEPGTYSQADLAETHPLARWLRWNDGLDERMEAGLGDWVRACTIYQRRQLILPDGLPVFLVEAFINDEEWFREDLQLTVTLLDAARSMWGRGCSVTFRAGHGWKDTPTMERAAWPQILAMAEGAPAQGLADIAGVPPESVSPVYR